MKNPNLYIPPRNKAPTWVGWMLGVGFAGIIAGSGAVAWSHVGPLAAAPLAPAVVAAMPAVVPLAAVDGAPGPATSPAAAVVTAKPAVGQASDQAKSKIAKVNKRKSKKLARYSEQRSKQILAKHDSNSNRQSKQKLDRMLGL